MPPRRIEVLAPDPASTRQVDSVTAVAGALGPFAGAVGEVPEQHVIDVRR